MRPLLPWLCQQLHSIFCFPIAWRPQFLWGLLAFFCSVTVGGALYYLLPFDMSNVQHIVPAQAGVILLCVPLGMGVMGILLL
jgi:hypothetical protein